MPESKTCLDAVFLPHAVWLDPALTNAPIVTPPLMQGPTVKERVSRQSDSIFCSPEDGTEILSNAERPEEAL